MKTRVKIAVAVNPDGSWRTNGLDGWPEPQEKHAVAYLRRDNPEATIYFLTSDLERPDAPKPPEKVEANVQTEQGVDIG